MQTKFVFTQRLDPIQTLLSFQQQANHYKFIVNPRKTSSYFQSTDQQKLKRGNHLSLFNTKFQKQRRQSIRRQNKRIFKDCIEIQKKKGILQRAEQQFRSIQSQGGRRLSLKNPFKCKQKELEIKKENQNLKLKIDTLKPLIGDKKQWKKHQQKNNKLVEKLRCYSSQQKQRYKAQNILKLVITNQKGGSGGLLKFFKMLDGPTKQQQNTDLNKQTKIKTDRPSKRKRNKKSKKKQINNQEQQSNQGIISGTSQDLIKKNVIQIIGNEHQQKPVIQS